MEFEVDTCGLLCPLPVLRARKRLMALPRGAVLLVRATDRASILDMPHFCAGAGHEYLGLSEDGAVLVHRIRRGASDQAGGDPA